MSQVVFRECDEGPRGCPASCVTHVSFTGSSPGIEIDATPISSEGNAASTPHNPRTGLVHAPDATCDDFWLSWPAMQERAIAQGTVVVFNVFASVGNLFLALDLLMQV